MAGTGPTQAGMTLIELSIAVAIGAIVLAALNSLVSLGLQAQTSGRHGNELVYQGRFALERMITTARSALPSVVIAATPTVSTTCGGVGAPVAVAGGSTVTLPAGRSIPANGSCTLTVNVTAAAGGSYINTLLAGALVTSNGNIAAPAVATLTVIPPGPTLPSLGQAFSPATINANGVSTLTLTLSNPNGALATLSAALIDTLPGPSGVVIAPTPNVSTTCGGVGAPVALAGSSTVTLPTGRSIPANGSCKLTVNVTAAVEGSYINTLPAGALVTSNGNNAAQAVATLTVIPSGAAPPTLDKAFSPASINAGDISTLTVTLRNPNALAATLTAPLIDTLPSAVVIAATPPANSTGNWFSPVMYCLNSSSQLIETTTAYYAANACTGTTVIASNVTSFFAQPAGCVGAACVMFCRNASNQLIKTTTTDTNCTGTTVIASNVTSFFPQPSGAGPVDRPVGVLFLLLTDSAAAQPVWLTTSVRLGGGTL